MFNLDLGLVGYLSYCMALPLKEAKHHPARARIGWKNTPSGEKTKKHINSHTYRYKAHKSKKQL